MENSIINTARKSYSRVLGSVAAYIVISIALIYLADIITLITIGPDRFIALEENSYYLWGMQLLPYFIAFPLFILFVRKMPSAKRESQPMSFEEFGCIFLISQAISMAGSMLSNLIVSIFEMLLGREIANTTSELIDKTPIWIIILIVVIVGPIVEEMIFRKVMIDKLSVYGDRLAVVVSAVAFGIFHGNFYQIFYATALGLVLGYMYTKTGRSQYNCLLHMAINFMGTIPSLLTMNAYERLNSLPEDAIIEGNLIIDYYLVMFTSYLQIGLAIAGVVLLISAIRNHKIKFTDNNGLLLERKDYPRVVLLSFGSIAFLVVCITECILSLFA